MIMATDRGARFEVSVNHKDGIYQARWTALAMAGDADISETDVRDFDRPTDAWEWIDNEAARRGWRRNLEFGPDHRPK